MTDYQRGVPLADYVFMGLTILVLVACWVAREYESIRDWWGK